jgi:hypothetical protein
MNIFETCIGILRWFCCCWSFGVIFILMVVPHIYKVEYRMKRQEPLCSKKAKWLSIHFMVTFARHSNALRSSTRVRDKKEPRKSFLLRGSWYWQRPTLAQPRDALPSANARFTSVFGMGTGGATLLRSPDCCGGQLRSALSVNAFDGHQHLRRVFSTVFLASSSCDFRCQRTECSLKIIGKGPLF